MASLSVSPNPVPFGATATVTATFDLQPGAVYEVKLFDGGVERAAGTVTFEGETAPTVNVGSTNQGWEVRTSGGTLTPLGNNQFRLSA